MKASIKFVGFIPDTSWDHFKWHVLINGESFEYRTGLGHETRNTRTGTYPRKPNGVESFRCSERNSWIHAPHIDEVLSCIFSDSDLGMLSFNDFCGELGYSSDSIKALDAYRACMTADEKIRRALGAEYFDERDRIEKLREEGKL